MEESEKYRKSVFYRVYIALNPTGISEHPNFSADRTLDRFTL